MGLPSRQPFVHCRYLRPLAFLLAALRTVLRAGLAGFFLAWALRGAAFFFLAAGFFLTAWRGLLGAGAGAAGRADPADRVAGPAAGRGRQRHR